MLLDGVSGWGIRWRSASPIPFLIVAAVMIETDGEPKKIFRVTLPVGVQLVHGTRIAIDGAPEQSVALCDLLCQRLHVGLRGDSGHDRQPEEGPDSRGSRD